ncbi:MAG: aminoacyl-tRNA hydrolase [Desulfobacteraceae bacterium]|nr:aminoacyl-tRNA hydrolase [Desulfobacteraceae bacterium]
MIQITDQIAIDEAEIKMDFIRSSGPGGQNVNKVASAVHLRFSVADSPHLPEEVKLRLLKLAGKNITENGVLIIKAKRYRSQEKNRKDAVDRLIRWIQKALVSPRKRRPTSPSAASRERKKNQKLHRGRIKKLRRPVAGDMD